MKAMKDISEKDVKSIISACRIIYSYNCDIQDFWENFSIYASIELIKKYHEFIRNWNEFCKRKDLLENDLFFLKDKNCCYTFLQYQDLSEKLIREMIKEHYPKYNVNFWSYLSKYQNLSEEFIQDFKDKIDWKQLSCNTKIQVSDEFTIEFDKKLGDNNVWKINNRFHRILGPAIINYDSKKEYWYRGKYVKVHSNEEYFEWLKYKDF